MLGSKDARDGGQACRKAIEKEYTGHHVYIIANDDTVFHRPTAELVKEHFGSVKWNGSEMELYRDSQIAEWRLIDSLGNAWSFEGCAVSGPATGQCLDRINFLKDFWFDWKNYHPQTTVYSR